MGAEKTLAQREAGNHDEHRVTDKQDEVSHGELRDRHHQNCAQRQQQCREADGDCRNQFDGNTKSCGLPGLKMSAATFPSPE